MKAYSIGEVKCEVITLRTPSEIPESLVFRLTTPIERGREGAVLLWKHASHIQKLFYGEGLGLSNPRLSLWREVCLDEDRPQPPGAILVGRIKPKMLFTWFGPYVEIDVEKRLQEWGLGSDSL